MSDDLRTRVQELEPWRHDIDLGPFSTFEVAESTGPYDHLGHPQPRGEYVLDYLPDELTDILVLGCNAGGIAFMLEDAGWDVVGVDMGVDGPTEPLEQARFSAEVRESDITIVEADATEYIEGGVEQDVVVACGLLYHIESDLGNRNTPAEQSFVDDLLDSGAERVLIETNDTPWFPGYVEERGAEVVHYIDGPKAPPGVREFLVFDP